MARWKALKDHKPMPVSASGVRLVVTIFPKGVSMALPPALGIPPGAVWQTTQSPAAASCRPRSSVAAVYTDAPLCATGAMADRPPANAHTMPTTPASKAPARDHQAMPFGHAAPSGTGLGNRAEAVGMAGSGASPGLSAARTTSGVKGG